MDEFTYRRKKLDFEEKFIDKFFDSKTSEKQRLLLVLKSCDWNIHPYSLNGRTGYKKYLRKAIKLLKNLDEENFK